MVRDFNGSHDRQSSTATFQLGGNGFADDKTYVIGTSTDPVHPSTLRTGDRTRPLNDSTLLASANAAQVPLPGNPGYFEFLSWGWWTSSVPDPHDHNKTTQVLGNFVVGQVPTVALPTIGSATYTGFMAGVAQRGSSAPYTAAGSYQNTWNFQTGRGAFTGNFDGKNYSGMTQGIGGTNFAGNFNSTGGGYRRFGRPERRFLLRADRYRGPSSRLSSWHVLDRQRSFLLPGDGHLRRSALILAGDEVGDAGDIVAPEPRQALIGGGLIGGDGDDAGILGRHRRCARVAFA